MTEHRAISSVKNRLLIIALVALVVVPLAVAAGYAYMHLAADNPWLLETPLILLVIFPAFFLLESWLQRREWLKRMTGGGVLHEQLLRFVTFFLPAIIIFSVIDLNAGTDVTDSAGLADYLANISVTMACLVAALAAIEVAKIHLARWWKQWRTQ